jgi:hypothetical protein
MQLSPMEVFESVRDLNGTWIPAELNVGVR